MSLLRQSLVAAAMLFAAPCLAQTAGTPVETGQPVPLPPDKQATVKEHVRRTPAATGEFEGSLAVGTVVPPDVTLFALPQDTVTEVPQVTSYRFVLTKQAIAVVEPESRKVIQLIQR